MQGRSIIVEPNQTIRMKRWSFLLEKQVFGICTDIAEWMGVKTRNVRLTFIYLSFLTVGSPVLAYLIVWFWSKNAKIWRPWTWSKRRFEI